MAICQACRCLMTNRQQKRSSSCLRVPRERRAGGRKGRKGETLVAEGRRNENFEGLEGCGAFLRCLVPLVLQPFVKVTRQSHPSALSPPPRYANSFSSETSVIDQSYSKIGRSLFVPQNISFFSTIEFFCATFKGE